ncbi:MAG TPA: PEGA domain-containing protein [Polyangium sp.]|nr:PEGA domain-containing protein [Polyangium sp.]
MLRLYEGQLIAHKYRLLQPLAKGGMGSVWTGKHVTLNLALLLRDLGRPIDTLDVLDELKNDFPVISPENEATAQKLRQDLEKVVGTAIWDGDYPGATIFINGTNVGTMPMGRPIRLTIGMHNAKVELAGYRPLETSFVVESQKTTTVAVALAPAHGPPPKPRPKPWIDKRHGSCIATT